MVNVVRVKRQLPSLLLNNATTNNPVEHARHNRLVYRLDKFKKRHPEKYNSLMNRVVADLSEFEKNLEKPA